MSPPTVGILALQGDVGAHGEVLEGLGASVREVRRPHELDGVDALVLPGGESTTLSMLLDSSGLRVPVAERLAEGMPALGTCAGMILLAGEVLDGRPDQASFAVLDVRVRRNGYGRQVASFEADLVIDELGDEPFPAAFIRAPRVDHVGPGVEVLAVVEAGGGDTHPVLCRQGPVVGAAFHPELSPDDRIHRMWLRTIDEHAAHRRRAPVAEEV